MTCNSIKQYLYNGKRKKIHYILNTPGGRVDVITPEKLIILTLLLDVHYI